MALTKATFSMINGAVANVLDYGADPTGVADSTSAIQAAFSSDANGIYFPEGTYLITSTLNFNTWQGNKRVFGDTKRYSVIKAGAAMDSMIVDATGTTRTFWLEFENLYFDGDNQAKNAIYLGNPTKTWPAFAHHRVYNCYFTRCTEAALRMWGGQYVHISDCYFGQNQNASSTACGVYAQRTVTVDLNDCVFDRNDIGIEHGWVQADDGTNACGGWTIYESEFYSTGYSGARNYLSINKSAGVMVDTCAFENEQAMFNNEPVVLIKNSNTGVFPSLMDITFRNCNFGSAAYNSSLVKVENNTYRLIFDQCYAVRPGAGYYVLDNVGAGSSNPTQIGDFTVGAFQRDPSAVQIAAADISGSFEGRRITATSTPVLDNTYDIGTASRRMRRIYATSLYMYNGDVIWTSGVGSPAGVVVAPAGSLYTDRAGGAGATLYVKESGTGSTGWVAK